MRDLPPDKPTKPMEPPQHGDQSTIMVRLSPKSGPGGAPVKKWQPVLIALNGFHEGKRFPISAANITIGRSADSNICLPDEGVSRKHARLLYKNYHSPGESPICVIEDMGSRNGVDINGVILREPHQLIERDRITLGSATLGFFLRDQEEFSEDQALYNKATRDALTGLDNRHKLLQSLRNHLPLAERHGYPISLLLLDIDHFKKLNDSYGHDIGDVGLRHIASVMRNIARASDIVARWGGEEFVIVLPHTDLFEAESFANRLRQTIEASDLRAGPHVIRMTVSVGAAQFQKGDTEDELLKRADTRLYQAKRSGRNRVVARD